MSTEYFVSHILAIFVLLLLAAVSAIVFKRLKFSYTIGLVIIGILFSALIDGYQSLSTLSDIRLNHDIIFYIILPTLIFQAAININSRLLVKNLLPVSALAIPGLVISTLIVGALMVKFTPLGLGGAMLFGALISATDPVAVIALFNEIGSPKRLKILVDGESLFNDATAIVVFNIVMAMTLAGVTMNLVTVSHAIGSFMYVFVGGLFVGFVVGFLLIRLVNLAKDEPLTQIALSVITAYASFIIADYYFKVSGVMSALGAGIVVGWYGTTHFSKESRGYIKQYWDYAAFIANSFIFLMLGMLEWDLLIRKGHSRDLTFYLVYAIIIVTFARFVVVYGIIPLLRFFPKYEKINFAYKTVIFWGGLRGAVPLALVLSLSSSCENHQLIVECTLGVVLFTLLVQGTTTEPLMKLFKLGKLSIFEKIMCLETKLEAIDKGSEMIKSIGARGYMLNDPVSRAKQAYKSAEKKTEGELLELRKTPEFDRNVIRKLVWNQAISIELGAYRFLFEKKFISESIFRELEMNVELELDGLKQGRFPELRILAMPLEIRLKNWFINLLRLIIPKNKFIHMVRLRTLSSKYELMLALIYTNNRINSVIEELPQPYEGQKEIVKECQRFYKKRADLAMSEKEKLEKYVGTPNLQYQTLFKAAANAELETIEELSMNGGIPDTVANILKTDIDGRVRKVAKNNPDLSPSELKI